MRRGEISSSPGTVYIGGGTPSLLSPSQLTVLTDGLRRLYSFPSSFEFTVEANPGTLNEGFLSAAVSSGVNRLSLGMQAFQQKLLGLLGRIHTFSDVEYSVSLARKAGIRNLNLDLIFGIPGQSLEDWNQTLDAALSLSPEHLSAYGLIPEEGTPFYAKLMKGQFSLPDPELERKMYDLAIRKLRRAGLNQYEISNFSRKGYECRHNIGYWRQVPYLGLGLSAASMQMLEHDGSGMKYLRTVNPSDPVRYAEMVRAGGRTAVEAETVSPPEARFETVMLSLRMNRGVSESRFLKLHGVTLEACYGEKLKSMEEKGLMVHKNGSWALTRRGMDIQNSVLVELMEDPD